MMHDLDWTDVFPADSWRVYIVDDDELVCELLAAVLATAGYRSTAYSNPNEFLDHLDQGAPGCVLLDIQMPVRNGLQVQQALVERGCTLPIVFISAQHEIGVAVEAMKQGAFDFIEKPVRQQPLLDVVHRAVRYDMQERIAQLRRRRLQNRFASLSPRERDVLSLLLAGGANKSIAADLGLSSRTVEIHRANIMEKMEVHSIAALVRAHAELHGT